jgi:hypothetical protein
VHEDVANPCAGRASFTPATLESPSLFRREASDTPAPAAYEIKFLLMEEQAREVEARLRGRLSLDSHADAMLGGAYRTTSLYTDTPDFHVFRRIGEYGNTKFRVRRYGSAGPVFLERKDKTGDKVHKTRVSVPTFDLAVLAGDRGRDSWAGQWFHGEIAGRRLAPVCRISYDRVAYLGSADGSAVRVTFDRKVRGEPSATWNVEPVAMDSELFPHQVICEFKYRLSLPRMFKEVIESLGLHPTPCSKYRRFIAAAGLASGADGSANGAAADV